MNSIEQAISKMSGDISVTTYSQDDVVDIINAFIQLSSNSIDIDTFHKFQQVRKLVLSGDYSKDKLNNVLQLSDSTKSTINIHSIKLTELQLERLQRINQVAYEEYLDKTNSEFTVKVISELVERYPEPPHVRLVYYNAKRASAYYANYEGHWNTLGGHKGDAIAWAYNGGVVHLLHFVDGLFDIGIRLSGSILKALRDLYTNGGEAIVKDSEYGDIDFRCTEHNGFYIMYNYDNKIMTINDNALRSICITVDKRSQTPGYSIDHYLEDLSICR